MSLKRTLESEVMEGIDEAATYDDMDHSTVNRQFVDDLLAFHEPTEEVFDIGTGTARIPIELCRRREDLRVVAVDLSVEMLDVARLNVEVAQLMDQIQLDRVDAKATDYEAARFETVISNSLLHHLPKPDIAVREAIRLTSANGHLFFRDLMRPNSDRDVERLVATYAKDESDHVQQLFHDSLHAALTLDEMREIVCRHGFADTTVQASSDRHWTWATMK
jgi:ubiquinone/menaquinone biosynthesis C-methylase UbiE